MARITLEAMEDYVSAWNAERRRKGWKQLYYIKQYPNEYWEVRETFDRA